MDVKPRAKKVSPHYIVTPHARTGSYVVERTFPSQANMVVAVYGFEHQARSVADELNRWAGVEKE